jgi:hypothetical protein
MTVQSTQQASPAPAPVKAPSGHTVHTDEDFSQAMALLEGRDPESDEVSDGGEIDPLEEAEQKHAEKDKEKKDEVDLDPEKYDKILDKRRQLWNMQKKIQQEKEQIARERAELEALRKQAKAPKKGEEVDPFEEIINGDEEEWLPPSKLKEKLRTELLEEFKQLQSKEIQQAEEEANVDMYKSAVAEIIVNSEDKYPMANTFMEPYEIEDAAFAIVERDYQAKAQRYGHDYAAENVLTPDQAAELLEKQLANKYTPRLKSERSQKLLRQLLGGQKDSKQSVIQTLSSDEVRNASLPDDGPTDWDDRVRWAATKLVPNLEE